MASVEFDPYDWKIHEDPYPVYRALRDEAPAYFNEERGFWALSRHADVVAAMRDPETFSSARGVQLEDVSTAANEVMSFLALDPPRHDDLRSMIWRRFTRRAVSEMEAQVRGLCRRYIDLFVDRGECDLIQDFAGKVPMDVVCEMMGVPTDDRNQVRQWVDEVVHREEANSAVPPSAMMAGMNLLRYFTLHLQAHKRQPGEDDLTDTLVAIQAGGSKLTDMEIIAMHFLLAVAGNETTTKLVGNAVYWMSREPDQLATVRQDPTLVPQWVEETLRYDPSSQRVARTLTKDVTLHGRRMLAGQKVALLIGSANRDERALPGADVYDIGRAARQSIPFGHGTHFCLGASLARLEGRVCLEELLARLSHFELDTSALVRVHSPNVRGFARMPMRFEVGTP